MAILALHGGAGGDGPWRGLTDLDPQRLQCLENILSLIGPKLQNGQLNALDAVTLAVEMMEDEELYNAGRGSVIAANGNVTMDASIMRGCDAAAGSVVNVKRIRHPIRAANLLLHQGWPVMLNSDAADTFAIKNGVEEVEQQWLITDLRRAQWQKWRDSKGRPGSTDEDDSAVLDHDIDLEIQEGMGTVGAVALDCQGRLAAATSTGGMTGKPDGRIGDTPIIGAGTWCDTEVAVSCTGVGEAFIRTCAAHEVANQLQKTIVSGQEKPLLIATQNVLKLVAPLEGRGGIIAISKQGEVVLPFQTMLMYRGYFKDGKIKTGIGQDEYEFPSKLTI
ncbi:MAG: beta-aspartyl-peptidase [Euryarchaeota archaeon]|jgi:beta-aspartyl-peptidase (threonine type)|nr:beta-aspartyl-peptidase [Euryarchaeota archaeon]